MNSTLSIRLETTEAQHAKLLELQRVFADVCNALAPVVQRTACWNRVALHHLAYRPMREQFPALGSQMICNALYSVSRASRLVYQHPNSPFNLQRLAGAPLPTLRFLPGSPVYFDRHTLSLKDGQASMYTLDGRMRFNLPLAPADEQRFRTAKLREIVLLLADGQFQLRFVFGDLNDASSEALDLQPAPRATKTLAPIEELPEYLLVMNDPQAAPPIPVPLTPPTAAASLAQKTA